MNWPGAVFFLLATGAAGFILVTNRYPPPENELTYVLMTRGMGELQEGGAEEPSGAKADEPEKTETPSRVLEEAEFEDPGLDEELTPAAPTRAERLRDLTGRVTEFERAITRAADADAALDASASAVAALSARIDELLSSATTLAANQTRTPDDIEVLQTTHRILGRDVELRLRMMGATGHAASTGSAGNGSEVARTAKGIRTEISNLREATEEEPDDSAQLEDLAHRIDAAIRRAADPSMNPPKAPASASPSGAATSLRNQLEQLDTVISRLQTK